MTEGESSGGRHSRLAADPTGPHDFDEVLRAQLREILPEVAVPADARATIQTIDACATDLAALRLSGGCNRGVALAPGETPDPLTIHELRKSAEEYPWGAG